MMLECLTRTASLDGILAGCDPDRMDLLEEPPDTADWIISKGLVWDGRGECDQADRSFMIPDFTGLHIMICHSMKR